MVRNRLLLSLIPVTLIVMAFLACRDESPDRRNRIIQLATHGLGSMLNSVGTGLATLLTDNLLDIDVRALATSGPTEWMPMMASEALEFGVLSVWDARAAWRAESVYKGLSGGRGFPIALVAGGDPGLLGVVVAESSGIRSVQQLVGRRVVASFTGSPGLTAEAQALLANHNLSFKDIAVISTPSVHSGVRAVIEGRADASAAGAVGSGVIAELDAVRGARFLPSNPDPEAVRRMRELYPSTVVKVSPGPDRPGVREEMYMMTFDFYLVGRRDLPEGLVYRVLEVLWDHNEALVRLNHQLRGWNREVFVNRDARIPYHSEAVRFYRDRGVWTEAAELTQQRLERELAPR